MSRGGIHEKSKHRSVLATKSYKALVIAYFCAYLASKFLSSNKKLRKVAKTNEIIVFILGEMVRDIARESLR